MQYILTTVYQWTYFCVLRACWDGQWIISRFKKSYICLPKYGFIAMSAYCWKQIYIYIYIYTWLMHLVDRLYYFIFIRETSRLGRHILVSVLFWPCLKCNWLIFKWMNGVSLPKMHQCVYYLTSNSCLLSIFFRKKEFNLPPSYN